MRLCGSTLLNDYGNSRNKLREWGYQVEQEWTAQSVKEVRRFLTDWIGRMNPLYMAVSLPPTFAFPEESDRGRIIRDCILPVSRETGIPYAMMIGVKRAVNPSLRGASDTLDKASLESLEYILKKIIRTTRSSLPSCRGKISMS